MSAHALIVEPFETLAFMRAALVACLALALANGTTPAIAARSVLLPAPFAPTTAVRLPETNSPLTPSNATRRP